MNTNDESSPTIGRALRPGLLALAALLSSAGASPAAAAPLGTPQEIVVFPDRDNTIYGTPFIEFANGKGIHVFTGTSGSAQARRTLLHFDVASKIPAGSTILTANLQMHVSKVASTAPRTTTLHRMLVDWGEGPSDALDEEGTGAFAEPGDASWNYSFYPTTLWAQPGGDFVATPSATKVLTNTGNVSWSTTPVLVSDVQLWRDTPAANFGWVLVGEEGVQKTAKRMDSRENPNAGFRPALRVSYLPPAPCATQIAAAEVVRLGSPANPAALQPGATSAPVLGSVWDPRIDHGSFLPTALLDVLALGTAQTNTPSGLGTILTFPPLATFTAAPGAPFTIPIPADCGLAGLTVYWQGASADAATIALTNSLDVVLGTF